MSSCSSRLLTGNHPLADALEAELSTLYGDRAAMLFNSGYHANTGILPALAGRHDLVLSDRLNHASIIDGLKISDASWMRYRHLDYDHLEELLSEGTKNQRQCFIISESIFSMDGDRVDCGRLVELKKRYGAILILDEAHALAHLASGVWGSLNRRVWVKKLTLLWAHSARHLRPPEPMHHGSSPAAVSGQYCKAFYFYDGHPSGDAFLESLDPSAPEPDAGGEGVAAGTCLQPPHFSAAEGVHCSWRQPYCAGLRRSEQSGGCHGRSTQKTGISALPVRPPTVPENTARLRISLRATLHREDVSGVLDALGEVA